MNELVVDRMRILLSGCDDDAGISRRLHSRRRGCTARLRLRLLSVTLQRRKMASILVTIYLRRWNILPGSVCTLCRAAWRRTCRKRSLADCCDIRASIPSVKEVVARIWGSQVLQEVHSVFVVGWRVLLRLVRLLGRLLWVVMVLVVVVSIAVHAGWSVQVVVVVGRSAVYWLLTRMQVLGRLLGYVGWCCARWALLRGQYESFGFDFADFDLEIRIC